MRLEIRGMNELFQELNVAQALREVKEVVKMNGAEMHKNMQRDAAVDTGFMKRSIVMTIASDGLSVTVAPTAEYAPYVEFGTRFMSAKPFVRSAYYNSVFQFQEDLDRLMGG